MQAHLLPRWLTDFTCRWDASVLSFVFVFLQHGSWRPRFSDPRDSKEEASVPFMTSL